MLRISPSELLKAMCVAEDEVQRNYIGASGIGNECERAIWYAYNLYERLKHTTKQKLIFRAGHLFENLVKDELKKRGMRILTEEFTFCDEDIEEFRGHCDGIIIDDDEERYILEIKTAKNASFNIFKNKGLRVWSENYYTQIQSYMGMSGLHEAYLFAINKDNCDFHDEYVTFDEKFYKKIREKVMRILHAKKEPDRVSDRPMFYKCKMCDFREICHTNK